MTFSASFYEEEEEDKVGDKVADKLFKEKAEDVIMGITVFISFLIAIALFMLLPTFIAGLIEKQFNILSKGIISAIEGVLRILVFIIYIIVISKMEDIQRTYMYHGAEHKCINCIEEGRELTVDNVMSSSRFHKRCGTSFLLFVMIISVIMFMIVHVDTMALRLLSRVILIPVIAGISYEVLRLAGRSDSKIVNIISAPGLWLQRLTTREPSEDMVEVAIKAIEAVFDWESYINEEDIQRDSE